MSTIDTTIRERLADVPYNFMEQAREFRKMMLIYDCAIGEMTTKLHILDKELAVLSPRNPISFVKSRLKNPDSIMQKLIRNGLPLTTQSIVENLNDVAGVRVICSYIDDIYKLVEMLGNQDDLRILEIEDYIQSPKENGYRSLHLVVEIPVFLSSGRYPTKVEVQIRTIAMDFWASLEHEIHYKKEHAHHDNVTKQLLECANIISLVDRKMLNIRQLIDEDSD